MSILSFKKLICTLFASLLLLCTFSLAANFSPAYALTGAVFTTDINCNGTNVNIFPSQTDVYLDGGPHHNGAAGLPDGDYYVQVTEPNGTLLGTSVGSGTPTPVHVTGGNFATCYELWNIVLKNSDNTQGFDTTTNGGGEYKVWISADSTFTHGDTKTDNFKVNIVPPPDQGSITGLKWQDDNADGVEQGSEELLPNWEIELWDSTHTNMITSTTTDTQGFYEFDNVTAGTYQLCEVMLNSSWHPSYPTTSTPNCNTSVDVKKNKVTDNINFGNYQDASLTVIKHVINDNGGTKVAGDFTMGVTGTNVSDPSFSGAENPGTTVTLKPGSYSVGESGPTGYTESDSDDCKGTLTSGQTATCTITNDDTVPALHLRKTITNDNGGNAQATDWTLSATGTGGSPTNLSGSTPVDSDSTFQTDTYALAEANGPSGYQAGAWDCGSADMPDATHVTVPLGAEITCTINNNDIPAHLIVIKHVINNNGGNKVAGDFTTTISGVTTATPTTAGVESPGVDNVLTSVGSYDVDEGTHTGYLKSRSTDCFGTIALGETKTCTITNNDIAPLLTVIKHVVNDNGGNAAASAFTMLVTGTNPSQTFFGGDENGTTITLDAGSYSVGEIGVLGYQMTDSSADCLGSIDIGEHKTCTITNDDLPAHLIVIKHVINDDGDVAKASDFTMNVTGTNVSNPSFPGAESPGTTVTLDAGSYNADEVSNAGYIETRSTDCSGSIANGQTKTCTITNNDKPHATRTQGFWQTHTAYTWTIFGGFGSGLTIGTHDITTKAQLFGGFYAPIPKTTAGTKRSSLDQARMQMLQQWLAAELNCKAFGCTGTVQTLLTNAAAAWAGTNVSSIQLYASQLDAYNNSNDALPISAQGKATPKDSQGVADSAFWNTLP